MYCDVTVISLIPIRDRAAEQPKRLYYRVILSMKVNNYETGYQAIKIMFVL